MTTKHVTRAGTSISDDDVEAMADEAERGCDNILRRRPGDRPAMGSGPASVESVRLIPN